MSSEPAVRLRGVSKCYPAWTRPTDPLWRQLWPSRAPAPDGVWAVRGVDLEVARGETVGLIGRNGCGKSTLLQMICGTMAPTEGEIAVRGRIAALLELGAGFNRDFTGRENIHLNASILGLSPGEVEERMERVIAFADIGPFVDRPVRHYSSGMFARLAFAVAIHVDPDLLVIDEILAVGDEAFQRKCFARIEEIRSTGASVLFVSHSAHAVVELCDRALFMDGGEVLFDGTAKDAVTHYHRLLYAPPERLPEMRDELRAGAAPVEATAPAAGEPPGSGGSAAAEGGGFDPRLEPDSTVVYDVCGARIERPRLLDAVGRPVNQLESGRRYRVEYDVHFEQPCFDVRLHMLLKRISGLELGGGLSPPIAEPGFEVAAGEARTVAFDFDCRLMPGAYFLNCGVTGNGGKQLHRIVDALMFRVRPIAEATVFGVVNFGCSPSVRPLDPGD